MQPFPTPLADSVLQTRQPLQTTLHPAVVTLQRLRSRADTGKSRACVVARSGIMLTRDHSSPRHYPIKTDPNWDNNFGVPMDFRLTYEGPLPAASQGNRRVYDKHRIRKALHPQLRRLWSLHPLLRDMKTDGPGIKEQPMVDFLAQQYQMGNYQFVPLVIGRFKIACKIGVLLLRPDPPGEQLIKSGDIDNRIKVLFDALRIPHALDEIGNNDPDKDETPFYCLLEDDAMINHIDVETDILLQDVNGKYDSNAVRLIMTVNLKPYLATWENSGF